MASEYRERCHLAGLVVVDHMHDGHALSGSSQTFAILQSVMLSSPAPAGWALAASGGS